MAEDRDAGHAVITQFTNDSPQFNDLLEFTL